MRLVTIGIILFVFASDVLAKVASPPSPEIVGNCGARCLFTILVCDSATTNDYKTFLSENPECRQETMSLDAIFKIASKSGLNSQLIQFDPEQPLPRCRHLIAHVSPEHFLVLSQKETGLWYYCDPPSGVALLSPMQRSRLSGVGLAIDMQESRISVTWIVIGFMVLTILSWLTYRVFGGNRRLFLLGGIAFLTMLGSQGCTNSQAPELDVDQQLSDYRFDPTRIDLGSVKRSVEPSVVTLNLLGSAADDTPSIVSSCGCVDVRLGRYDDVNHCWPILASVARETVERKQVQIVASSTKTKQSTTAAIVFRVIDQIELKVDSVVFDAGLEDGEFVGVVEVKDDPQHELADIRVLFSTEQVSQDCTSRCERAGGGEFLVTIAGPVDHGYQHAYLQFFDFAGDQLHPELAIEWGEMKRIEANIDAVQLSKARPKSSFVLHSDNAISDIKSVEIGTELITSSVQRIDSGLIRVVLDLQSPGESHPEQNFVGELVLTFVDGERFSLPLTVESS